MKQAKKNILGKLAEIPSQTVTNFRNFWNLFPPDYDHCYFVGVVPEIKGSLPDFTLSHKRNARYFAEACLLSYANFNFIRSKFGTLCQCVQFNPSGGSTQCVAVNDGLKIIILFRGTQLMKESKVYNMRIRHPDIDNAVQGIARDLQFYPENIFNKKDDEDVQVHAGFKHSFLEVWDGLFAWLKHKDQHDKPIWIAGHSLGGAVATMAAVYIKTVAERKIQKVYTYGSPRLGNRAFVPYFNSLKIKLYRYIYNNDIIAHVPPYFANMRHVGIRVKIQTSKKPGGKVKIVTTRRNYVDRGNDCLLCHLVDVTVIVFRYFIGFVFVFITFSF